MRDVAAVTPPGRRVAITLPLYVADLSLSGSMMSSRVKFSLNSEDGMSDRRRGNDMEAERRPHTPLQRPLLVM